MKTFTVRGGHWEIDIEVDNSLFEKYGDMAFEAMTQGVEKYLLGEQITRTDYSEEPCLIWIVTAHERGFDGNPDKTIVSLTENVLRNAGQHKFADEARSVRKRYYEEYNKKNSGRKKK